jgi:hypothetical protein
MTSRTQVRSHALTLVKKLDGRGRRADFDLVRRVEVWVVAAGFRQAGLGVIGHDQLR